MSRVYEEIDAGYAKACSEGTLCSGSRGFFRALASAVSSLAAPDWLDKLASLPEMERIDAVKNNTEVYSALEESLSRVTPLFRGKDARASQQRREAARATLAEGDLPKALAISSQAVLRAPPTGSEEALDDGVSLALALWQRSEILMKLGRARAALTDLRLALKEHLPARMRSLYYWRMGHCYKGAGEPTRAKVSYELAARLIGSDETLKSQLNKDIESLDFSIQPSRVPDKIGISLTTGAKQNMPSLSNLLKISEEENRGRFAVAASQVKSGDVLLVDTPYAACLLHDYYGTHCLHCFKRLDDYEDEAPIWCPKCSGVAFCSIQCRDAAVSTYHAYECQFLDFFIGSGMSILSHTALRMITQAGLDTSLSIHSKYLTNEEKIVEGSTLNDIEGVAKKSKIKNRKERLNRSKKSLKMNEKNIKEEDEVDLKIEDKMNLEEKLEFRAAQIYSLCTHTYQRTGEDCLKRIIMGLFLTECLKKGGFFKSCSKENFEKAEAAITALIVCNLQLLQFNAHEIYETIRGHHQFSGSKPLYIAVGIYPTGALFNHECYPAVSRYFEGNKLVLRASRPLESGDVVSENYGPHFLVRSLRERQRSLASRYWFRCDCRACREDWPTLKQMSSDSPPYLRCPATSCTWKFKGNAKALPNRCAKCSTVIDNELVKINMEAIEKCVALYQVGKVLIDEVSDSDAIKPVVKTGVDSRQRAITFILLGQYPSMEEGARLMEAERVDEAIESMCNGIDQFHISGAPPHKDTHLAQEALRSCFAAFGNVHKVQELANDDINISKESIPEL